MPFTVNTKWVWECNGQRVRSSIVHSVLVGLARYGHASGITMTLPQPVAIWKQGDPSPYVACSLSMEVKNEQ